jgi:FMNH2-dependent dimethyl sulfone monooxygenase
MPADAVHSGSKMKLGVFGSNLEGGFTATKIADKHHIDWETVRSVAQKADQGGFEIQVPLARWASLGGETDFCGVNLEPLTWAAGLAEATTYSKIFATVHAPLIHPILAAKQMTTIDQISDGRFGLNIVVGWNPTEFAMYGQAPFEKNDGYAYAQEWIDIVNRLWTTDEPFDHHGRFFDIPHAWIQPKPISQPRPILMNAGMSPTGSDFAARNVDVAFSSVLAGEDPDEVIQRFARFRDNAKRHGREIEIWTAFWVACRDTDQEAQDYYEYVIEQNGDTEVLAGIDPRVLPPTDGLSKQEAFKVRARALAGFGTHQLIGNPDTIAQRFVEFSELGLDGAVLIWPNYEEGVDSFNEEVIPRLERLGIRQPFNAPVAV